MTTTAHALTGAAIAVVIKKPKLAIPLAFLSHFACDALPHFGIGMNFGSTNMFAWLIIDGLAAIGFAIFLLYKKVNNPWLLAICGFAAMSPDLAWFYYGLKGVSDTALMGPISQFHAAIQWSESVPGILVDVAWISLMLTIILRLDRENHKNISAS